MSRIFIVRDIALGKGSPCHSRLDRESTLDPRLHGDDYHCVWYHGFEISKPYKNSRGIKSRIEAPCGKPQGMHSLNTFKKRVEGLFAKNGTNKKAYAVIYVPGSKKKKGD
ncbi:MAG: hypothetical protein V3U15_00460 [Nitrospinota bacterium]